MGEHPYRGLRPTFRSPTLKENGRSLTKMNERPVASGDINRLSADGVIPRLHRRRRDRWKNDMENTKSQDKPKGSSRGGSELGVVSIDFNPGPDAQDRLRRLFTLLVKYATKDKLPPSDADSPSEDDPIEDEG